VEFLQVLVDSGATERFDHNVDGFNELGNGSFLNLSGDGSIVEVEWLSNGQIFVGIVLGLENELDVGVLLGAGWSSNVSSGVGRDEVKMDGSVGVLFVSLGSEDVVSEGRVDVDLLRDPFSSLKFNIVVGVGAGVEDITSDTIGAAVVPDIGLANLNGGVGAVFVRTVLTDLDVGIILGDDLVVSKTVSDDALLLDFNGMGRFDLSDGVHVNLESVGNTSLNVSCPFGDASREGGIDDVAIFNVDLERSSQGLEFRAGLEFEFRTESSVFSVLNSELKRVQLDIQMVSLGGDVKLTGDVEGRTEGNIIVGTGNNYGTVIVHVFFTSREQVSSSGPLDHTSGNSGKRNSDKEAKS
jgi:hypothetical protein